MNPKFKITFNIPENTELTQHLIINSPSRDQALIDAGYLAVCYGIEVISVERIDEAVKEAL